MGVDTLLDVRRIGRAVKERRLALDFSQEDLAKRADVSSAYISRLERGQYEQPGAVILERISRALGLRSWSDLEGPMPDAAPPATPRERPSDSSRGAIAAHTEDGELPTERAFRELNSKLDAIIDELAALRAERLGREGGEGG